MDEVLEFLKKNPTYYLATIDENGKPQVRPFGTISKIGDALYFETGKVKQCYKEMIANPAVSICAFDAEAGTWLRVCCDVEPDDSIPTCQALLDEYPSVAKMYKAGDGNCVCMKMKNVKATFYSFTSEPKTVEF